MAICAICKKEKSNFTKEHIIPYALGNRLFVINCVCKKCNSNLGDKIDAKISNSFMACIFREVNKLPGQSGKVPIGMPEGKLEDGRSVIKKDGKYVPKTHVEIKDETMNLSATSKDEALEILKGFYKKRGKEVPQRIKDEILNKKEDIRKTKINFNFSFDIYDYAMETLKIAYETFIYYFDVNCLKDKRIDKLRDAIYRYIYNDEMNRKYIAWHCVLLKTEYKEKLIEISKLLKKISPSDVCHIIKIERDENSNKTYFFVLINGSLPMCFFTKTNKKYALNKLILVTKENKIFEL